MTAVTQTLQKKESVFGRMAETKQCALPAGKIKILLLHPSFLTIISPTNWRGAQDNVRTAKDERQHPANW